MYETKVRNNLLQQIKVALITKYEINKLLFLVIFQTFKDSRTSSNKYKEEWKTV